MSLLAAAISPEDVGAGKDDCASVGDVPTATSVARAADENANAASIDREASLKSTRLGRAVPRRGSGSASRMIQKPARFEILLTIFSAEARFGIFPIVQALTEG